MSTDDLLTTAVQVFQKSIDHLRHEYVKLQIGRANPVLVEGLDVEAYGIKQKMKALANVSVPDARTLQIQPWDKGTISAIEKAIQTSGLNLTPNNDGNVVRINFPPLTEERRKELVKLVHKMAEDARISVRQSRQEVHAKIKEQEKEKAISETEARGAEKKLQEKVDSFNKQIEELAKAKEKDVMTI